MFETLYFGELVGMIWSFEALTVKLFFLSIPQFLFIVFEIMRKIFFLCLTLLECRAGYL